MDEQKTTALALPDEATFLRDVAAINRFQKVVHAALVDGQDYGVIPGTGKPTLLKPGAEKITKLLGLADQYEILDKVEDWDRPLFRYLVKARLVHLATGCIISEGLGECNSMEGKYRWRDSQRKCPTCGKESIIKGKADFGGGWLCWAKKGGCGAKFSEGDLAIESQAVGKVANEDIYSQVNTILKMAKKRALVDAALSAGRLSDVFTQDMDEDAPPPPPEARKAPEPKPTPRAAPRPQIVEGKATPAGESVDIRTLKFKNPGEFYAACHHILDMAKSAVDPMVSMYDLANPEQREKAWLFLIDPDEMPF